MRVRFFCVEKPNPLLIAQKQACEANLIDVTLDEDQHMMSSHEDRQVVFFLLNFLSRFLCNYTLLKTASFQLNI